MAEGRVDIPAEAGCPVRVIKWGKPTTTSGDDGFSQLVTVKMQPGFDPDGASVGEDANGHAIVQFSVMAGAPDPSEALLAKFTSLLADAIDGLPQAKEGKVSAEVKDMGVLVVADSGEDRYFAVKIDIAPEHLKPSMNDGEHE